jgi:ABC-2 type transport system ATP-binding protein
MAQKQSDIAIRVDGVSKSFMLPHEKQTSIKQFFLKPFKKRTYERQQVLKNISFDIKQGEFFGIVGRNGSGKSTLLKLLAGIYTPDTGHIQINGKLTPFIELGVGFNFELTGRENVFLNGALLGFGRAEMEAMYKDIVAFAELERFMDQQLKNYSSGMQVRLAFSIAIRANSEILLLDEVLAVGDANFQRKCFNYFKQLKKDKRTVVFVSHDATAVQEFCDKAVLIDDGRVAFIGSPVEAIAEYNNLSFQSNETSPEKKEVKRYGEGSVQIHSISLEAEGKTVKSHIKPSQDFSINFKLKSKNTVKDPVFGVQVLDSAGNVVIGSNNSSESFSMGTLKPGSDYLLRFNSTNILHNGTYTVSAAIKSNDRQILYDQVIEGATFEVAGWTKINNGMVHPKFLVELDSE